MNGGVLDVVAMVQRSTRRVYFSSFGYRMCATLSSYRMYLRPTYCAAAGGWWWRTRRGWRWRQRRSWKRDDNIIIANVIFATGRTPFVRKSAKKYIFFTAATRHPRSSKDGGEEGVKIIVGC